MQACAPAIISDLETDASGSRLAEGWIVEVIDGKVKVDYDGNSAGPVQARSAVTEVPPSINGKLERCPVMLFLPADDTLPIVIGFIANSLAVAAQNRSVLCDGQRIVLSGKEEVLLQCGRSSIQLHRDGKIVIKGSNLISRSSGINRIRGAAVKIN